MDLLLMLIKKHNKNKTAGYKKNLAYVIYKQKRIIWGMAYTTCGYTPYTD